MANIVYNSGISYWPLIPSTATPGEVAMVALIAPTYSPDKDHDFMSSVATHEVSDASYSRKILTNVTSTVSDANDSVIYDADNVVWTALDNTGLIGGAVLFLDDTTDATRQLLAYYEISPVSPNGTDFQIIWDTAGIAYFRQG
jgi:hypothetical protein